MITDIEFVTKNGIDRIPIPEPSFRLLAKLKVNKVMKNMSPYHIRMLYFEFFQKTMDDCLGKGLLLARRFDLDMKSDFKNTFKKMSDRINKDEKDLDKRIEEFIVSKVVQMGNKK